METSNAEGIDRATGAVITSHGTIAPTVTKSQFLASPFFDSGFWTNEQDGWYGATTKPAGIAGEEFACDVMFHHEKLHSITLLSTDPVFGTSWDDHSWEKEAARNERQEQWLNAVVGPTRSYAWGEIWCGVDRKGGFASIVINYA